jgi:AraC-like DNA-binding protein
VHYSDHAYHAALGEIVGIEDHRLQQVHTYLQMAREGKSVMAIAKGLGLHSRSYVHRQIQRQALELVTEAFFQAARQAQRPDDER